MIPAKTHPAWAALIKGSTNHQFKLASASMLMFNLRSKYQKDHSQFDALAEEARKFFLKYEAILGDDIKRLFG